MLARSGSPPRASATASRVPPNSGKSWRLVVAVGRGGNGAQRDARSVHRRGAFDASFAPVHRAFPGFLASARGLGDAPVDGYVAQLQPDETIVGIERDIPEPLHQPQLYPLITPSLRSVLSEHPSSAILQ
jgi:hypothetical protein